MPESIETQLRRKETVARALAVKDTICESDSNFIQQAELVKQGLFEYLTCILRIESQLVLDKVEKV